MAVIAGLFDSQADAAAALDRLHRLGYQDMEAQVIEPGSQDMASGHDTVIPMIPPTGGSYGQPGGIGGAAGGSFGWLNDLDKVESAFYQEGLKEGATLAMVQIDDKYANEVRELLNQFGARTYRKD